MTFLPIVDRELRVAARLTATYRNRIIVAGVVLALILLVIKFTRGFLQNVAVLIGITVGYLVTIALGWTDFSGIAEEPIVRVVMPLQFGLPQFFLITCLTMCLVVTIVFIEATGMFLALGEITAAIDPDQLRRTAVAVDCIAPSISPEGGGAWQTFPLLPCRKVGEYFLFVC